MRRRDHPERVNPMTPEEIEAWEEILHGMGIEEVAQLMSICKEYSSKFYGFSGDARGKRTPEWVAKASKRLEGVTDVCCECGEDYPSADLMFREQIFCEKCRREN